MGEPIKEPLTLAEERTLEEAIYALQDYALGGQPGAHRCDRTRTRCTACGAAWPCRVAKLPEQLRDMQRRLKRGLPAAEAPEVAATRAIGDTLLPPSVAYPQPDPPARPRRFRPSFVDVVRSMQRQPQPAPAQEELRPRMMWATNSSSDPTLGEWRMADELHSIDTPSGFVLQPAVEGELLPRDGCVCFNCNNARQMQEHEAVRNERDQVPTYYWSDEVYDDEPTFRVGGAPAMPSTRSMPGSMSGSF